MKKFILGVLFVIVAGCGTSPATREEKKPNIKSTQVDKEPISDDLISQIIQSIPSPLEISFVIKGVNNLYNKKDLNSYNAVSHYDTQFKKALNLGIYGTDLGYANIYGKNQDALNYLKAVRDLANGLSIGQFFDYKTIKKLAESANNLDSLLSITQSNMEAINYHLRKQKRESLSILIIAGGWIEATYLTASVYQIKKSELLKEKIGEQKIVLDQILLVLDAYRSRPGFTEFISSLRKLERIYREIDIETSYKKPTTVEKDGVLVVIDNSETKIKIEEQDVKNIFETLKSVRNDIIK